MRFFGAAAIAAAILPSALGQSSGGAPHAPPEADDSYVPSSMTSSTPSWNQTRILPVANTASAPAYSKSTASSHSSYSLSINLTETLHRPTAPSHHSAPIVSSTSSVAELLRSSGSPTDAIPKETSLTAQWVQNATSAGLSASSPLTDGTAMATTTGAKVRSTHASSTTLYETTYKTVVHTVTSCPAMATGGCVMGSKTTSVVPVVSGHVIPAYERVLGPKMSLAVAINASVTVSIPNRAVILGGGVAYFPGLCESCGHFRVVFESKMLVKYHIEACAPEERNTVVVKVDGQYRYLGCAGDECNRMIVCVEGKARFAQCIGVECNKNLVCRQGQQCKLEACQGACFQVKKCVVDQCQNPSRTALPPPPASTSSVPAGKTKVVPGPDAGKAPSTEASVVGLITKTIISLTSNVSVQCKTDSGPAPKPAHEHKENGPAPKNKESGPAPAHKHDNVPAPPAREGSKNSGIKPAPAQIKVEASASAKVSVASATKVVNIMPTSEKNQGGSKNVVEQPSKQGSKSGLTPPSTMPSSGERLPPRPSTPSTGSKGSSNTPSVVTAAAGRAALVPGLLVPVFGLVLAF
ncbi:hypothetical protein XA68_11064 [Ophiocordyceps unilateralis]|uniref:Uncharacterized protein n=1 Tax=Ophiocordyceps unilateralis TaxID=268505 RepID=A0A2A9PHH3_OPHUN|nr:hypothetical protein XA68_11064 [Ophiocordyceps unilateralis]